MGFNSAFKGLIYTKAVYHGGIQRLAVHVLAQLIRLTTISQHSINYETLYSKLPFYCGLLSYDTV